MHEKSTNTPVITLPSSGSVPSAFWEMLNWGAVDRILWIYQKAQGTLPEDGNVMPKHEGTTIHN
jgi:hypothetical protein